MERITFDVQHPDFQAEEFGDVAADDALSRLTGHPWAAELARFDEMLARKEDACPPNVGLLKPDGALLRVSNDAADRFDILASFPVPRKFLGIKFGGHRDVEKAGLSLDAAAAMAKEFLESSSADTVASWTSR